MRRYVLNFVNTYQTENTRVFTGLVEKAITMPPLCRCTNSNINKKSLQNTCLKYCIPIIYFVNLNMQGKKIYQEKLFNQFRLSDRVPRTISTGDLKQS